MSVQMLNNVQYYVLKIKKKIFHEVYQNKSDVNLVSISQKIIYRGKHLNHQFVLKPKHFYVEMILQNYVPTNTNKLIIIEFDIVLII